MTNNQDINQLLEKLETLLKRQDEFHKEINNLRVEINLLKSGSTESDLSTDDIKLEKTNYQLELQAQEQTVVMANAHPQQKPQTLSIPAVPSLQKPPKVKSDIEKFIGENLINKIGIAITVIGVAIGAKYAIDHELISPVTRIILAYLVGGGLLGFALKLKKTYASFSAVLLSGAMAIMYFTTYAAYSYYNIFPQTLAFALMLVFTAFTVLAATRYNQQVIAHVGLVGAYAVPFLLSEGSGKVAILFAYMAIINAGILLIAFKRYWKSLYYSAFIVTWLIFFTWFVSKFHANEHFGLALGFLSVFFVIFYLIFLAYKLIQKEKFDIGDIILLLANSFIFYGIGYGILSSQNNGSHLLGLFSLVNAVVHMVVSAIIYRQKLADRNLFYLVSGLVLVFITISIPVQLDGNWVTLLWAGEAALLFWIGRTKNAPLYEKLSYVLMVLAFISIVHDWINFYGNYVLGKPETRITPLFNISFLTSLLFISAFAFINVLNRDKKYSSTLLSQKGFGGIGSFLMPFILLVGIYWTFRMEIANYWNQLFLDSLVKTGSPQTPTYEYNYDLIRYQSIWVINYSLVFVSLLALFNMLKLRSRQFGLVTFVLIAFAIAAFLTQGLFILGELRETYLTQSLSKYYHTGSFNIGIRYVSFVFVGFSLATCYYCIKQEFMQNSFKIPFDFLLHTCALWIASSELISWMDIAGSTQSDKLGLSILWGVYSLLLICLGIAKRKRYLRIAAIILFGVTLVKLFFYDISHFNTIAKTVVFVSLGVLLLIISFLYNKYSAFISDGGKA